MTKKHSNKDLLVTHDHSVIFNRHKARSHMHLFAVYLILRRFIVEVEEAK